LRFENETFRKFLAEIFGTFIFLSFSLASIAQYVFSGQKEFLSVSVSFGIGLTLAIIAVGQVSGKIWILK
jgi:glycerol uptake facilitator-like aquaporin